MIYKPEKAAYPGLGEVVSETLFSDREIADMRERLQGLAPLKVPVGGGTLYITNYPAQNLQGSNVAKTPKAGKP